MPPLIDFRKLVRERPKTPSDVLAKACAALRALEAARRGGEGGHGTPSARDTKEASKEAAAVGKYLGYLKFWLFGDESAGHEPTKDSVIALVHDVVRTDFTLLIVRCLALLDFETRKDAAQVFGAIVRIRGHDDACPGAAYVGEHPEILTMLFDGYNDTSIALVSGSMYRDCIRDEAIARHELYGPTFMEFFARVEVANFEIASDAFASFKDLLTRHKAVVAAFLTDNYAPFFEAYSGLLQSSNYVTRRQSLKLLAELLLDRSNVRLMMRYVGDAKNLMLMMVLLKDGSRSIQFEAFHVFKVFVANPSKPRAVVDILRNNRDKLLKYLEGFHAERDDDEQFREEKAVVIKEISLLGPPPPPSAAAAAAGPLAATGAAGGGSSSAAAGAAAAAPAALAGGGSSRDLSAVGGSGAAATAPTSPQEGAAQGQQPAQQQQPVEPQQQQQPVQQQPTPPQQALPPLRPLPDLARPASGRTAAGPQAPAPRGSNESSLS